MKLILVGCEYAGKTTLANEIVKWTGRTMGGGRGFHDHFTMPPSEYPEEDQKHLAAATPFLRRVFLTYMIDYHMNPAFYSDPDHNMVGFHIEEAVYAPLYYGYTENIEFGLARYVEKTIMQRAPDTVLILMKASPEVIARRMKEDPHSNEVLQEKDIDHVLGRFEEEYGWSLLRKHFELDTTSATVEETLAEFVDKIEPFLSDTDRLRIATHQSSWKDA
jgi:shikimate kinase